MPLFRIVCLSVSALLYCSEYNYPSIQSTNLSTSANPQLALKSLRASFYHAPSHTSTCDRVFKDYLEKHGFHTNQYNQDLLGYQIVYQFVAHQWEIFV